MLIIFVLLQKFIMGKVYINGVIGEDVTLQSLIAQVKNIAGGEAISFYINSAGGDVDAGFAIHDFIKNLEVETTTIARGQVDSIATVIFQAGKKRLIESNLQSFVIHNVSVNIVHPAAQLDFLEYVASVIREDQKRIAKFYTSVTSIDINTIETLMRNETNLKPAEIVALGLADSVVDVTESILNLKLMNMNIIDFLKGKLAPKNKTVATDKGEIVITDSDPIGQPVTLSDGTPAQDGMYSAEGKIYSVEGGVLVSIEDEVIEDAAAKTATPDLLNIVNQIAELTKAFEMLTTDYTGFKNSVNSTTKKIELPRNNTVKPEDAKPLSATEKMILHLKNKSK